MTPHGRLAGEIALLALGLTAAGLALRWALPEHAVSTLILFFVWAVVCQSWNLVWGIAGVWSMGQLAIFATAGYSTGWLVLHAGLSPYLAALLGMAAAVLASLVIALPSLRLKGVYVILLTISFHEIFRILLTTDTTGFTGGIFGLPHFYGFVPDSLSFTERLAVQYYVGLALFVVATAAVWWVLSSRLGLAFKANGQAPLYAASRGVSLFRTQVMAFVIGGVLAGAAGAFWAQYFGTMQPAVLSYDTMVLLFAMMVIGGWATFSGPILGAFVLVWVAELLHEAQEYRMVLLGGVILATSVFLPGGLVPLLQDAARRAGLGRR